MSSITVRLKVERSSRVPPHSSLDASSLLMFHDGPIERNRLTSHPVIGNSRVVQGASGQQYLQSLWCWRPHDDENDRQLVGGVDIVVQGRDLEKKGQTSEGPRRGLPVEHWRETARVLFRRHSLRFPGLLRLHLPLHHASLFACCCPHTVPFLHQVTPLLYGTTCLLPETSHPNSAFKYIG